MSGFSAEELQYHISQLTDDELWRLVNVEAAQYREEALIIAKDEIARRGADFQPLIEPEKIPAEESVPEIYSEEEQIRIDEELWDKDSKPIHTIGISLACWVTYSYFAVTEPEKIWFAPVIAFGVCAGLDILRAMSSKEYKKTNWRHILKSAVTISLLSVVVAGLAHWVFLLLGAVLYEFIKRRS